MSEPLIHFAIPLASLALAGIGYRKALIFSIFALIPDADALFHVHRSQSHSLILLVVVTVVAYLLLIRTKYRTYLLLASLGVASHILLDIFGWYTPALWPLWDQSIQINAELISHIASQPTFTFNFKILTIPTIFDPFNAVDAPIFTSEGLIISTLLLAAVSVKLIRNKLKKHGAKVS